MTEIPEHLLQRSKDRRRALGLAVEGDDAAAPQAAPTESANAPAVAAAAAPEVKAPVPIPAGDPDPPPPPPPEWVQAAEGRKKVPYWVMPVLLFLPIWLIMYVGTLEEPTREEGLIYEGGEVYAEHCASCHGAGGGGGVGPAFDDSLIGTFPTIEGQVAWVVSGSAGFSEAGRASYGATEKPIGGSGALMPAFGDELTTEELMYAVLYERIELAGIDELEVGEAIFDALDHGELEDLPDHLPEGVDLDGTDLAAILDPIVSAVEQEELASE